MTEQSATTVPPDAITTASQVESVNGHNIVRLPLHASAELPSRGQVATTGQLNGVSVRIVVEPDGNRGHWIRLDLLPRELATMEPGASVSMVLIPTKDWPEPSVPDDLQAALDEADDIHDLWESITPMARWEWVRWVNATKSATTRERRVEVGISKMRSGKRRPCCFDLSACTDMDVSKSGKLLPADS